MIKLMIKGQRWQRVGPMLMVPSEVVLKWVNSTPCQSPNYESIAFKFERGDYVPDNPNPAKFGVDTTADGAPTWWWNIRVLWLLVFLVFLVFFCF